ncbi:hypothetical protein DFH94DRAFT_387870 [Russula ochroleuca]|jgi:hypothetical protein|uniref:Uncharacterized protein n=1 Tax=Russula ochroleuca TaxID=152965 RepID=A0A9P5N035_9AGAM|nr:hypothetical protein DFH94DRAFT_387870 [Russula ochroleuca]
MSSHGHATTHRVLRSPQMEDSRRFPGNAARQHGRPRSSSPLADGRRPDDMGSPSSDAFSFDFQPHPVNRPLYFEPPRASGSQGPIVNPAASPQAHGMSDKKGKKRASVESSDACLVRSEIQTSASSPQTGIYSLGLPGSLLPSPARSHISLASSSSVFSFEFDVNISVVETPGSPGRSAHVAGSQPAPQPTVSPFAISNSRENAIPGPSTQRQEEGLNEEENGNDSQASSDDTRVEISGDVVDALDRTSSPQADRSVAFDDSPSLSRPLSPLIITSTSRSSTHRLAQSVRPSGPDTTTSSSSWVWPLWSPSLPPHVTSEASSSTEVTGLGLSIEGILSPSSSSQPLQHKTTTQAPPGTPHRHAGNVERQSPTRRDTSPRDAPISQAPATPPNLVSALSNLTQQSGVAPSPRNVPPLPSSPTTSTSGSPVRLQTQPSHRVTPLMPFYPSLVIDDNTPSTPSRLGIASGRPTPQWLPSPIQETAASRTPSAADPRSPISRLTRIPGSIMGISRLARVFFARFCSVAYASLQEPFLWSSDTSGERFGRVNTSMIFWREGKLDSRPSWTLLSWTCSWLLHVSPLFHLSAHLLVLRLVLG